ncbi:MAG TPA: FeoA family protein [Bryobacteraceae bacterium]|nr:FeoA family protein [Bryobacteraceae bacterium]
MLQLSGNKRLTKTAALLKGTLAGLREGEQGILEDLDVPVDTAQRLMELGFLPGQIVSAARSAPGGDPRVFRVDGSEVALRNETARHLKIRMMK